MDHFLGTKPLSGTHAFDTAALQAYLEQHLPGFAGPLTVEQFKGGQSNPTYKLITPQASYAMRSKPGPVAKLLPSAHAIEREFRVMGALAGSDVPVPRMHLLCEDESVIGRAFYVMQFVQGRVLWDQSLPGMTREQRGAIYDEMNRVIAALHKLDVAALGLADFGRPGNYFERQIARWSKQYQASITGPNEAMDRLLEWLPKQHPAKRARRIDGVGGARRLPARQPDLPPHRAQGAGGAGLGTVDRGPPAGRLQLPLHVLAHPAGFIPWHRRAGPCGAGHPGWSRSTSAATANAAAAAHPSR